MVWREAVRLDWQLFGRSLQQSSGAAWIALAAALLALVTMGESSYRLGVELRSHLLADELVPAAVARQLVAAFVAAFLFVLATGELAAMRLLLADLALRPVSRRQAFLALQAISAAGRHTLALLSVGLPLLILLGTWLDGVELAAAIVAVFVLMRLPVALLTIGSRVAGSSMTILAATGGATFAVIAALWLKAPDLLNASLPPMLVTHILVTDSRSAGAWAGLAAWTLVLALLEYSTMGFDSAPAPSAMVVAQPHRPIPVAIRLIAQLSGCPSNLLHGELLRLTRWRRYLLSWLMCAVLMVMLDTSLAGNPGLLRAVIVLLLPVHVGGSILANLFAADRAGFQAFALGPVGIDVVIRAKVVATLLVTVAVELLAVTYLAGRGAGWLSLAAGLALAAGLFAWTAATGTFTSALFPSASDPQTVSGSLVNTPAFVVIAGCGAVYIGAAVGLAYLVDSGRTTIESGAIAGTGLVLLAVAALVTASYISPSLVAGRLETIISALTARTEGRA